MTRARNLSGLSTVTGQPTTTTPVNLGPLGVGTFARIYGTWEQDQINAVGVAATNLQVSGITTGLNVSGIITAQNGLNINGNIVNGLNVSAGISTFQAIQATNATFSGTLTYEDLTNVDSIGVGTFRKGIIVAGVSTFNNNVDIADDKKLLFGTGEDLSIYHTTSDNDGYIKYQNENGHLKIGSGTGGSGGIQLWDRTYAEKYLTCDSDSAVEIYYNGNKKLETTNSGVAITGEGTFSGGLFADSDLWMVDQLRHTGDTNTAIRFPAADTITAETAGSERLRIDSSGLVGINQSSPRSILDVFETTTGNQTAIRVGNTNTPSSANDKRIEFVDGTGTTEGTNKFTYAYVQAIRAGGANSGDLIFGTKRSNGAAPVEAMRIDDSGNVGVGTATVLTDAKVHIVDTTTGGYRPLVVQGSATDGSVIEFWNNGAAKIRIGSGGANNLSGSSVADGLIRSEANMLFAVGNTEKAKINSSGDTLVVTGTVRGDAYQSMRLGNTNTASVSDHYWKIGEATLNGSEGFTLEIDTGCGYSPGGGVVAHTTCVARAMNNTTLEGYWYSTSMSGAAGVKDIRWKYTGANNIYEIWVKANQYGNIAPIIKLHGGTWTAFNTNTGSSSAPGSSTAFNNGTHYTQIEGYNTIQYNQQNTTFLGDIKMADGKGIDFSLDGNAGGMTSELLDDYEEGTWTPVFTAGSANGTFSKSNATGTYTKVGRFVYIQYYTGTISTLSGFSGQAYVSNLPFTSNATGYNYPAVVPVHTTCFTAAPVGYISNNSSIIVWLDQGSTTAGNEWNNINTTYLMFSATYEAT